MPGSSEEIQKDSTRGAETAGDTDHTQLSENDLDQVSGGTPRDAASGLPTGKR